MSQEPSYTIIQKDQYGLPVNTMTGFDEMAANTMAEWLRTGDAYTGDRPWTVDIERELTDAEKLAQRAETWLTGPEHTTLATTTELAVALELLAERLRSLGDHNLGQMWLTVDMQVTMQAGDEPARRAAVDLLASVAGVVPEESPSHGLHGSYGARGEQVKAFTPVEKPTPQAEAPVATELQALADDGEEVEHYHQSASTGGPGECSASCACGTTFDGFDTVSEAIEQLNQHIANPDAAEHRHVGGAAGGPGENEAECSCGTVFAGFDTHAEAVAALDKHITARRNGTPEPVGT